MTAAEGLALGLLLDFSGYAQLIAAHLYVDVVALHAGQLGAHHVGVICLLGLHRGYPRSRATFAGRLEELAHAVPQLSELAEGIPELPRPAATPALRRSAAGDGRIHPSITSSCSCRQRTSLRSYSARRNPRRACPTGGPLPSVGPAETAVHRPLW